LNETNAQLGCNTLREGVRFQVFFFEDGEGTFFLDSAKVETDMRIKGGLQFECVLDPDDKPPHGWGGGRHATP
jgi:hypothetical protein